jgi:membrane protease YdiL (CAAX protease family)
MIEIRQYSTAKTLLVWAAAAAPMGVLAWVVAPRLPGDFTVDLVGCLAAGLAWQCLLVLGLVYAEQRTLRWRVLCEALWLRAPSTATRRGGRLWWWALAAVAGVGLLEALPTDPAPPAGRGFDGLLGTPEGQALFHHNWGLFALVVAMFACNTVLGEELLFRGLLLPRMRAAFGRGDWIANAVLFAVYHLHQPWSMPSALTTGLLLAGATRRWRSAWLGIIAHSAQSAVFTMLLIFVVVK